MSRPSFDECRPAPLFSVGEEVIVAAPAGFESGAGSISRMKYCAAPCANGEVYEEWHYRIDGYWNNMPDRFLVAERWLRKKPRPDHQPADEEFTEWLRGIGKAQEVKA